MNKFKQFTNEKKKNIKGGNADMAHIFVKAKDLKLLMYPYLFNSDWEKIQIFLKIVN